jgi:tetratricopeptide (TPR) repeat protein
MSDYIIGPNSRYTDFLQAKSFEKSINGQIERSSREIVATHEQLHAEHIEVTRELSDSIGEGLESISYQLSNVRQDTQKLDATCELGFTGIIELLGLVGDQLYDLQWMAKHPSQTWANEQFHEAMRSFERGWHKEALSFIQRSLNGHGSNIGCAVDFRYHHLLGAIRLGNSQNFDENIVDLDAAEKSFLESAKFSRQDEPNEAANALVCASRAAYCRDSMKNAEQHARDAVSLNPSLGPAHFQVAKVLMHVDRAGEGLPFLEKAIRLDRDYSWVVLKDEDFKKYSSQVKQLLTKLSAEVQRLAEQLFTESHETFVRLSALNVGGLQLTDLAGEHLKSAGIKLDKAERELQTKTYFGYLNANPLCKQAKIDLAETQMEFYKKAMAKIEADMRWAASAVSMRNRERAAGNHMQNYMRACFTVPIITVCAGGAILSFVTGGKNSFIINPYPGINVDLGLWALIAIGIVGTIIVACVIEIKWALQTKKLSSDVEMQIAKLEEMKNELNSLASPRARYLP